jgi:CBS domain-containing protein
MNAVRDTRFSMYHFSYKEIHMEQLKDIMSPDVQVISPDATIREAAQKMREGDFGMMPVAENDRMIGAISDRDIALRAIAEGKGPDTQVRDVMSQGIAWAYEDDSVDHAAEIMSEHQVRRLPVVNRQKRLVGIVALGDFAVESSDLEPAAEALVEISQPG